MLSTPFDTVWESWLSHNGYEGNEDVLIVPKAMDPAIFEMAAQDQGLKIYDFDDVMPVEIIQRAEEVFDIFTTDTPGHQQWLYDVLGVSSGISLPGHSRYLPGSKMTAQGRMHLSFVIPDCIDYDLTGPVSVVPANNRAVWFGNHLNEGSVMWMAHTLLNAGVDVAFICDLTDPPDPRIELLPRSFLSFPKMLREFGTCILSHATPCQVRARTR